MELAVKIWREELNRKRTLKFYIVAVLLHVALLLPGVLPTRGCLHKVPAGVPMGKGNKLTKGKTIVVRTPKKVRRKRKVRKSPVTIYETLKEEDLQTEARTAQQFSDNVGVPGGVGSGATAAGSPRGTVLGGKLYFYRVKFSGPGWEANSNGVRPLMNEVKDSGVVKKVAGYNNVVTLEDLPRHSGEYFPSMLYMTGTGNIEASEQEVKNLRDYLAGGGMLFADVSGGSFHEHFVNFMRRVLPGNKPTVIEYDHEIFRGGYVPYAMIRGCPIYRKHLGAGPSLGWWIGPRISVFYSRGDLGAAWGAAGLFKARKRNVEQAFRMGVNIISYSLLYYKYTGEDTQ
jgi:hypothetical protein